MPADDGKENLNESYTNKYQKHVACSCDCKSVSVDDKFSKQGILLTYIAFDYQILPPFEKIIQSFILMQNN